MRVNRDDSLRVPPIHTIQTSAMGFATSHLH
jgi:hypothetical protein